MNECLALCWAHNKCGECRFTSPRLVTDASEPPWHPGPVFFPSLKLSFPIPVLPRPAHCVPALQPPCSLNIPNKCSLSSGLAVSLTWEAHFPGIARTRPSSTFSCHSAVTSSGRPSWVTFSIPLYSLFIFIFIHGTYCHEL